jgi:hypothetical protein
VLVTAKNFQPADHLRNLQAHLLKNRNINPIVGYNPDCLDINSRDALRYLQAGDARREPLVPAKVTDIIKERGLFGYRARPATAA